MDPSTAAAYLDVVAAVSEVFDEHDAAGSLGDAYALLAERAGDAEKRAAAELLIDKGAAEVYVAATHGVLSGPAIDRLKNAPIKEVILTNTLPIEDGKQFPELKVLSIAPIIADALDAVFEDTSVSQIFEGDNL